MSLKRRLTRLENQYPESEKPVEPKSLTQAEIIHRVNTLFRSPPTLRFTGPQAVEVHLACAYHDLDYAAQMVEAFGQWFKQNPGTIYFPMTAAETRQALTAIDAGDIDSLPVYNGDRTHIGFYTLTPVWGSQPMGDHTMTDLCHAIEGALRAVEAQTGHVIGRQIEHIEQFLIEVLEGNNK